MIRLSLIVRSCFFLFNVSLLCCPSAVIYRSLYQAGSTIDASEGPDSLLEYTEEDGLRT